MATYSVTTTPEEDAILLKAGMDVQFGLDERLAMFLESSKIALSNERAKAIEEAPVEIKEQIDALKEQIDALLDTVPPKDEDPVEDPIEPPVEVVP